MAIYPIKILRFAPYAVMLQGLSITGLIFEFFCLRFRNSLDSHYQNPQIPPNHNLSRQLNHIFTAPAGSRHLHRCPLTLERNQ